MSNLIEISNGSEHFQSQANEELVNVGEKLGVPFSCLKGNCGTCLVEITEGVENLSPITEAEDIFGLEDNERLLCQAKILKGKVTIQV